MARIASVSSKPLPRGAIRIPLYYWQSITYEWDGLHVDGPYVHSSYDLVERLLRDLRRSALKWADGDST